MLGQPETVTLNDILITAELWQRVPRQPNWQAEAQAMQTLARQMAANATTLLQTLVDLAVELCQAGTAGISLLESGETEAGLLRWAVLAGTLAHHVGDTTLRSFSPCGACLDHGTPQLFSYPERHFTYLQAAHTPIVEGLVLPLVADGQTLGTIWVLSHDEQRHFDLEDMRIITSLADFAVAARLLDQQQTQERSIPTGLVHLPPEQIGSSQTLPSTAIGASAYVEEVVGWLPQEGGRVDEGTSRRVGGRSVTQRPKILLVDDNPDMRSYLKRLLSQQWQVETAANGAIALTQIQQNPPDLVLTDVMMPEMDGLQLLQALRANPQTRGISIMLLSARAGEEAMIEGLAAGADDYLIKPFTVRELLARVETHLQLTRLRQEQSATRFKDEFLLTVTHELQAPLTAILGWARLLQTQSFDTATTIRALATIERNATIEAKLIKDLLDLSSLLSHKVQLKSQLVDVVALVKAVVPPFREVAEAKEIQFIDTLSGFAQQTIVANGDRFKQIIAHLLENAIKFTPKGGEVAIYLQCLDAAIEIQIRDTGIGISPEFLPYVFERFSQAEVPSRYSPGGVGIGLAIARLLVELHHGTIEVVSEGEGQGTTFIVQLPLVQ
ncbi:response regulator [Leptolyngbya sp. NK1-12]|uniref:histidine kinase n=1 Tax=Leptolyngbya sp. NK1-12 TaxID=2547451 RepID=A0AA96WJA4_9CYAN|nr:response regulator [Leptolyngbya sp. NK1-12]